MKKISTALIVIILLGAGYLLFQQSSHENSPTATQKQTIAERLASNPGIIIDVRTEGEYNAGHLKQADYNFDVTSGEFEQKLAELDRDTTYYLYCRTGNRSGQAASIMKQNGFADVHNIGGFESLVESGLEAE